LEPETGKSVVVLQDCGNPADCEGAASMHENGMTPAERRAWNSALDAAKRVVEDERGSREAFEDGSAAGWDAACEWIGTRIEALRLPNPDGTATGGIV